MHYPIVRQNGLLHTVMLRFSAYSKSYGSKLVVSAPDLSLDQPLYWLRGGNGCGKTTLLHSIAGIIPFRGNILINGAGIRRQPRRYRLSVAYSAAEPAYPAFLPGRDLVAYYLHTKQGTEAQFKAARDTLQIGDYLDSKVSTYSSGMLKKLSLALAFIGAPRLILLDEPLITLDQTAVAGLAALIARHASQGARFLLTSHQELPAMPGMAPRPLEIRNAELITV